MKLSHKLCGAALVAAAGVALAAPNTTKAVDNAKTGTGHIEFTFDTGTSGVIPTDPGVTDGTTITNLPSVTNPGEFGIIAITPLEFESHDVLTANTKRDYDASLFKANPGSTEAGTEEFDVQNFVKYQDLRTQENHAYKLSATLTQQFTDTASGYALNGSSITYKNAHLTQTGSPELTPDASELTTQGTISEATPTFDFLSNTGVDGKGYGQFELNFGDKTTGNESVTMNIPTSTAVGAGDYNAVITWTLSETL
ncbi:WxL domain-containing protein [Enterococcus sp. BWB1-3]|uniref:WxL domain-containing protein n=1 Tax=unclassified Enterococcus TaxID=2608891 RepID=UPI00192149AE|nr:MULTISPECIES: WxL domain-containing protein [unclassified Enterococcus]MBL1229910.1 WxL domain-containing protein [Enterococcus sp. BWB1-3]MCB5951426.1 WxL domain-containing protein [Enterococcus sp. BWT-B8]MCB5954985.1 WxL domain-containing protein [Enterococcus sp. CWB-B31]